MVPCLRLDRHTSAVLGLTGIMLVLHFAIINLPEREMIFDEAHYVPQARALLSGSKISLWHPPLGVCLIAFGMAVFGDRGFGWRFSSVVFGVLSIWVLYLLVRRSTGNKSIALLSSTLYAFDSLTFVQSSIAMLDIFFVFFMLLGFLFYWRNNRLLAFVAMALSTLCKLVGVAGFGVLVVMMLIDHEKPAVLLKTVAVYVLSVTLPFWVFLLMQGHLVDPFSTLLKMALGNVSLGLSTGSTRYSQPWDWVINPKPIPYYVANIPRRYWIRYRGVGNPMIWLLTLPSVFGLTYDYVRHRRKFSLFVLLWLVMVYFLPWYPMALLSLRPLFLFYFLPAVGAVTISIAMGFAGISQLLGQRLSKIGIAVYLTAVIAFFILEFPLGF
jgi:predicted membrane-bound dolichyl-phosphate-mannose-protein mannosyltransferase